MCSRLSGYSSVFERTFKKNTFPVVSYRIGNVNYVVIRSLPNFREIWLKFYVVYDQWSVNKTLVTNEVN